MMTPTTGSGWGAPWGDSSWGGSTISGPQGVGKVTTEGVGWDFGDNVGAEGWGLEYLVYNLLRQATLINTVTTQVFLGTFPDNVATPSILFTRILGEPQNFMSGKPRGERATIQMDCFSTSYLTAFEMSTSLRTVMKGSTSFSGIQLTNQDLSQPFRDNRMLYRISQDYSCWYRT